MIAWQSIKKRRLESVSPLFLKHAPLCGHKTVGAARRIFSLFIDTEMLGLRIVRVGSQSARADNSFRSRRAVAPILPGFIGDALLRSKHALVYAPVHAASDDGNKNLATCLQENSPIHVYQITERCRAEEKSRLAVDPSQCGFRLVCCSWMLT